MFFKLFKIQVSQESKYIFRHPWEILQLKYVPLGRYCIGENVAKYGNHNIKLTQ